MQTDAEIVIAFLDECGKGKAEMQAAFRRYFTPETIWENVGMATTTGPDEALALMAQFEATQGVTHFGVEMLAIATQGGKVLTERIDTMLGRADGAAVRLRLMGIFEVEDGRITAWRDYFDTTALAAG